MALFFWVLAIYVEGQSRSGRRACRRPTYLGLDIFDLCVPHVRTSSTHERTGCRSGARRTLSTVVAMMTGTRDSVLLHGWTQRRNRASAYVVSSLALESSAKSGGCGALTGDVRGVRGVQGALGYVSWFETALVSSWDF